MSDEAPSENEIPFQKYLLGEWVTADELDHKCTPAGHWSTNNLRCYKCGRDIEEELPAHVASESTTIPKE